MYLSEEDLPEYLATDIGGYFPLLVLAYQHKLYALTCGLVGNRQDAEEIVQEAFFCAYQALKRYPLEQVRTLKLQPWMTKIILNRSRNHRRHQNGKYAPTVISFDTPTGKDLVESLKEEVCPSPEAEVLSRESRDELLAQIAKLPDCYREVVSLHYIYGLPYHEIAAILDHHSVDTVKSQARRGFLMLKQIMNKEER